MTNSEVKDLQSPQTRRHQRVQCASEKSLMIVVCVQCVLIKGTANSSALLATITHSWEAQLSNLSIVVLLHHLQVGGHPDNGSWAMAESTCIVVAEDREHGTFGYIMHCPKAALHSHLEGASLWLQSSEPNALQHLTRPHLLNAAW